jgi:ParB-like chromosome segregation protein Spo0J
MAGVRGDFAALEQLQKRMQGVRDLAGPGESQQKRKTLDLVGAAFVKEVADEFKDSRDPYGKAWAPLARQRSRARDVRARKKRMAKGLPVRKDKVLVDTGRMRASVTFRRMESGLRVIIPVSYASYHQDGGHRIPQRMMVPDPAKGLGARWTMAAKVALGRAMKQIFGR